MKVINLTPHPVHVYNEEDFEGLVQKSPTTWVAEQVSGQAIEYKSEGVARISTDTERVESSLPGETVKTTYGDANGIPQDLSGDEVLIVSLPMQSMAKQAGLASASQMVAPYKVVRLASDTSKVLGCMGFTY
ncbi:MAG: hypothetical protein AAGA46_00225 [Cyanobacteria bacterium P01_F01_bin.13]